MYNSTFVAVEDRLTEKYADLSLDDRKVVILYFTALSVKAIHNALANDADFALHVDGAESWSWADIRNNGGVTQPGVNPWNEAQDRKAGPR